MTLLTICAVHCVTIYSKNALEKRLRALGSAQTISMRLATPTLQTPSLAPKWSFANSPLRIRRFYRLIFPDFYGARASDPIWAHTRARRTRRPDCTYKVAGGKRLVKTLHLHGCLVEVEELLRQPHGWRDRTSVALARLRYFLCTVLHPGPA